MTWAVRVLRTIRINLSRQVSIDAARAGSPSFVWTPNRENTYTKRKQRATNNIGGWGVRPTGKLFRFVSCVRAHGLDVRWDQMQIKVGRLSLFPFSVAWM